MNQNYQQKNHKIALVWHLDYPGGVQYCVLSLIKELNRKGIIPTLLWDHAPNPDFINKEGVKIQFQKINLLFPTKLIRKLPVNLQYFLTILNTKDFSQILQQFSFTYLFQNNILISSTIPHVRYLSGPPLLPQLENPRNGLLGLPYRFFRMVYKTLLKKHFPAYEYHRNNHYVINSAYTASLFEEAHRTRLEVVYPPISIKHHQFDKEDISQRDTLCFFSRITPAKRPKMVLQLTEHFSGRFVFMGGVNQNMQFYLQDLQKESANKLRSNIQYIINPDSSTIVKELSRTRFYVFPAINEHFGMTTVEAIASGAIPFVHDSGGQKEIVPIPELRFSDENFIQKFINLEKTPETDLKQIRNQLIHHIEQFSTDVYLQKMLTIAGF